MKPVLRVVILLGMLAALVVASLHEDATQHEPLSPAQVNYVMRTTTTTAPHVWITVTRDKSADVLIVQQRLVQLGYEVGIDGVYGPQTEAAVMQFQRDHKLWVDGIVGPVTTKALGLEDILGYITLSEES